MPKEFPVWKVHFRRGPAQLGKESRSVIHEEDREYRYKKQDSHMKMCLRGLVWGEGPGTTVNSSYGCFLEPKAFLTREGQNLQKGPIV